MTSLPMPEPERLMPLPVPKPPDAKPSTFVVTLIDGTTTEVIATELRPDADRYVFVDGDVVVAAFAIADVERITSR